MTPPPKKWWSVAVPGLAPSTSLLIEYDESTRAVHVSLNFVDVEGRSVHHMVPFDAAEYGKLARVTAGWPWRLPGE